MTRSGTEVGRLLGLVASSIAAGGLLLPGCTTTNRETPPSFVRSTVYYDYRCDQLAEEADRIRRDIARMAKIADEQAEQDSWRRLLGWNGGESEEARLRLSRLKGRQRAIDDAKHWKGCARRVEPVETQEPASFPFPPSLPQPPSLVPDSGSAPQSSPPPAEEVTDKPPASPASAWTRNCPSPGGDATDEGSGAATASASVERQVQTNLRRLGYGTGGTLGVIAERERKAIKAMLSDHQYDDVNSDDMKAVLVIQESILCYRQEQSGG